MSHPVDDRGHDRRARCPATRIEAITLQFHPNWPHRGGTVIESMAGDGHYRSQFVTGISNGGLTAHPGGDRWRWKQLPSREGMTKGQQPGGRSMVRGIGVLIPMAVPFVSDRPTSVLAPKR